MLLQSVQLCQVVKMQNRKRVEAEQEVDRLTCSVSWRSLTVCIFWRNVRYRCLYSSLNIIIIIIHHHDGDDSLSPVVVRLVVSLHERVEGGKAVIMRWPPGLLHLYIIFIFYDMWLFPVNMIVVEL